LFDFFAGKRDREKGNRRVVGEGKCLCGAEIRRARPFRGKQRQNRHRKKLSLGPLLGYPEDALAPAADHLIPHGRAKRTGVRQVQLSKSDSTAARRHCSARSVEMYARIYSSMMGRFQEQVLGQAWCQANAKSSSNPFVRPTWNVNPLPSTGKASGTHQSVPFVGATPPTGVASYRMELPSASSRKPGAASHKKRAGRHCCRPC
jgi:hypothetical protein